MADEPPRRRVPGLGIVLALAFLLLPIAGVAWWLNRPRGEAVPNTALTDLDVVCLGRVDGLAPVAALEPAAPGRVVAVLVSEGQAVKAGDQLLKLDDESLRLKA